ncbi:MAG TPA: ATP-binding protein, partial [Myxococcota bacterium]|nr:ATP-binding protein [Myxococcota bacterium]
GDGSLVDASVVLSTIRDPRGQAIGLSLIAHDARERVRAAARREQLQRELEDQVAQRTHELQALNERLAEALARAESATRAKSSFLANMSHEIRTPLNAIIGTSYLVKHANATPEQQEQLTRIERAASHLVEIISNILDLSKIETGKVSLETIELSIDTISRDVATMCESAARARDLEIRVDLAPMPWRLRGDVTRLRQAWLNYAANAVKFTDAGDITLRTRVVEERADRVCIRFEVEDTGIGVDREAIERLFAAFEQADSSTTRRYGGTGLGLAITRGLAELMDGAVGVDANPSGGSTFWFTAWLDRVNDVVAADVITDPEGGRRQLAEEFGGAQILLVEDDPINRTVAAQLLRLAELEPVCANNGREAVERAREARYAMVLMDMHMPEMDGLTATREIRHLEGWARVPIVAVTANASTEARQRCRSAGMNDLLTKPVEAPRLYATMLGWLRRAR